MSRDAGYSELWNWKLRCSCGKQSLANGLSSARAVDFDKMNRLSEHDKAVLNSVFNPLSPSPLGESEFREESENDRVSQNDLENDEILEPEVSEIQKLAILESESKNFDEALKLFEKALEKSGHSATLLNDRAQCLRLAGRNEAAMRDLNLAIEKSKNDRILKRALCQRGILYRINGNSDEARDDFSKAAKLGSKFAKSQITELNPYAAMCNQIFRDMTMKLNNP